MITYGESFLNLITPGKISNTVYEVVVNSFFFLLSNSENREHLENFRNIDCVLANHSKVQDTQADLKAKN